ncbi:MAG: SPFH/Band 7/PHB domain protein [Spirochaetaceae bacterium]|nr:SPFH/Band 7/PHB domain protein [Spirochaetaceae bacterium]GMO26324.1 MAG: SPFH domain-containing protein [Termitinemataceae bacterium]
MFFTVLGVVVLLLLLVVSGVKIVPQSHVFVIERLGGYHAAWDVGFHFLVPFIDRIAKNVSLKEGLFDFDPQPVITKDNVTLEVDTVVFYQISDPKLYTYGAEQPKLAIEKLTMTTLRNVIGELELDETLSSRDTINTKLRMILDDATDAWGIKVNRVEVKNIEPPHSVKESMEKQMRAEREKRAAILTAEGQKESAILKAEGEKQSLILQAEARKEAAIREAEGEAKAILEVQKATADGLAMIKEITGVEGAIKLKSFETFQIVADSKSTKIIIPSEIQNLSGLVSGISEVIK